MRGHKLQAHTWKNDLLIMSIVTVMLHSESNCEGYMVRVMVKVIMKVDDGSNSNRN